MDKIFGHYIHITYDKSPPQQLNHSHNENLASYIFG